MRQSVIANKAATKNTQIHYGSTYRTEVDQKDVILDKLKSEAEALKKNQQDFNVLKQQYADLNRKYRYQLQQKNLQDQDFKNRHDSALRHISQLKNQADAIKAELRDKKLQIQDLRTDEQSLRDSIDQRNVQIEKLRIQISAQLADSDQLQNQRVAFVNQADTLRKINSALSEDLFGLQKQNQACNMRLAELQKYLQQLQTEANILKTKIKDYEDTNNDLDNQIQKVSFDFSEMQNLIYECQQDCAQLQAANATIGTNVDQYKSEGIHNQKATQAEVMKNNDFVKKLKQAQHAQKIRMNQVQEGHNQIADLKEENQNLQKINNQLADDLEACRKHLQHLGLLNHQLINCLQNFSQEDKKVQQLINREQRVKYMRARVSETTALDYHSGKDTARTDVSFSTSRRLYQF